MDADALAYKHIADFLCAPRGTRWWLLEDGRLVSTGSSESLREGILVARSFGVGNLDSQFFTDGMYMDEEGIYWNTEAAWDSDDLSQRIGSLEDVVRHCCEMGDVSIHINDLARTIREGVEESMLHSG